MGGQVEPLVVPGVGGVYISEECHSFDWVVRAGVGRWLDGEWTVWAVDLGLWLLLETIWIEMGVCDLFLDGRDTRRVAVAVPSDLVSGWSVEHLDW